MGNTFYFQWEVDLIVWLQAVLGEIGRILSVIMTMLGDQVVLVSILAIIYLGVSKKAGKMILTNILMLLVLNPMLKNIVLRRRPYFDHEEIKCLKAVDAGKPIDDVAGQGYSFPSMHSANALCVFGSIAVIRKQKRLFIAACVFAFFVGLSRLVLGVHYPTDVLFGWLTGILAAVLMTKLQQRVNNQRIIYLILTILGAFGWFYCTSNDFFTGYGLMIGAFAAFIFEEKFVHFEDTRNIWLMILRVVGGLTIFGFLLVIGKLFIPDDLLQGADFIARLIRILRYAVAIFVTVGVYPMCFKRTSENKKPDYIC